MEAALQMMLKIQGNVDEYLINDRIFFSYEVESRQQDVCSEAAKLKPLTNYKPSAIPMVKPTEILHISGNFSFPRNIHPFQDLLSKDKQKLRYFCVFI